MINAETLARVHTHTHTHTHTSNSIENKQGVNSLYLSYNKQTIYF